MKSTTKRPKRRGSAKPHAPHRALAATETLRVLDDVTDGVIAYDTAWRIVHINAAAEALFGIRRRDALGRNHAEIFPWTRDTQIELQYRKAASGKTADFELFLKPFRKWVHFLCRKRLAGGITVILKDLTATHHLERALQASEFRFAFALKHTGVGAWSVDLGSRGMQRSIEYARIFGYTTTDQPWSYEDFLNHVTPEERLQVHQYIQAALAQGAAWDLECHVRRKDGKTRLIWLAGGPQPDAEDSGRLVAGIVQDITELEG